LSKLTGDELDRYARHIVLREIGGQGQHALKTARVVVIGAGGLGSPALLYLAAAGVGTLVIVDDDVVSLSNLQRQVIHGTPDIGAAKVESARAALQRINPHIAVEMVRERADHKGLAALVAGASVVLDGSDNFETRYAVADACALARVPLVTAAVGRFDGSLTLLKPFATRTDGSSYPGYRDLFPDRPPAGAIPACAEAGVLGALTGVMGSLMALEAIKEITGAGETLAGRLLLVDTLSMRFEEIVY
jgi:molybdopterin/thiamine biosynthesis adenylyltransferase